jgi:peptide/nickel transport system permease protein
MIQTALSRPRLLARVLWRMPGFGIGVLLCALITLNALLLPLVIHLDVSETSLMDVLLPPSPAHPFGTDDLGRDVLVRVLFGLRSSWAAALAIIPIAAALGTVVGLTAAWQGGWIDTILMRIVDVFLSFPVMIFALAVAAMLGPSLLNAILALSAVWWTWYARVSRTAALSAKTRGYVVAAQAMGVPGGVLLRRHILRDVLRPVVVLAAIDVGTVILVLGALSFIGAGAQAPAPELGLMVSSGLGVVFTSWWVPVFPGLAIFIAALAANMLATGLRDLANVQVRRSLFSKLHRRALDEADAAVRNGRPT